MVISRVIIMVIRTVIIIVVVGLVVLNHSQGNVVRCVGWGAVGASPDRKSVSGAGS